MELHTYAKRRPAKKWTIVQKRKLVEARIIYDNLFSKKPLKCLATWKKIVSLAQLDDFGVSFVRRQWSHIIAKYKKYKRSRLGNLPADAINDELLRKVSKEWEFFYTIHTFMSRKLTHLHSYALKEGQKLKQPTNSALTPQQQEEQNKSNASLASQLEDMFASSNGSPQDIAPAQKFPFFNSDTNEDYAAAEIVASETVNALDPVITIDDITEVLTQTPQDATESNNQQRQNTDHDSYSKKSDKEDNDTDNKTEQDEENLVLTETNLNVDPAIKSDENDKADSKSLRNSPLLEDIGIETKLINSTRRTRKTSKRLQDKQDISYSDDEPTVSTKSKKNNTTINNPHTSPNHSVKFNEHQITKPALSERDKYYRHKRRYNRRLEQRFDKLLNIFGQIVKAEYPNVDVSRLGKNTSNVDNYLRFPDQDQFNGKHNESEVYSQDLSSSEDTDQTTISSSAVNDESQESNN